MPNRQTGSVRSSLITVGTIIILLVIAFTLLPEGYNTDLSLIGKGGNVAVLAHSKDSVQSLNLMNLVSKVRGDYRNKINFLLVDVNSPEGRTFMQKQQQIQTGLLLFAPDGKRVGIIRGINSENALRKALDNYFMLQ